MEHAQAIAAKTWRRIARQAREAGIQGTGTEVSGRDSILIIEEELEADRGRLRAELAGAVAGIVSAVEGLVQTIELRDVAVADSILALTSAMEVLASPEEVTQ